MGLSIFLAKLLGFYLTIIAADMLLRRHELENAIKDFVASKGLLIFSGSTSIFLGLAIIFSHPVYAINWQGFITFLGYLFLVKGITRLAFPSYLQKRVTQLFRKRYWWIFSICLVIGLYLAYAGFSANNY